MCLREPAVSESPATSATPPPRTHFTFTMLLSFRSTLLPRILHSSSCPPSHLFRAASSCQSGPEQIHRCLTPSLLRHLRPPLFSQAPGCCSCTKLGETFALERLFFPLLLRRCIMDKVSREQGKAAGAPGCLLSIKLHPSCKDFFSSDSHKHRNITQESLTEPACWQSCSPGMKAA